MTQLGSARFTSCLALFAVTISAGTFVSQTQAASADSPSTRAVAARVTTRDDRLLASRTHALETCLHRHHHNCRAAGRAVRKAQLQLRNDQNALAASTGSTNSDLTAPTIKVSGDTLTWNKIANVTSYAFVRKVTGSADKYTVVQGTSYTPEAIPGATVRYSVSTAINGSSWAHEVAITYPASGGTSTSSSSGSTQSGAGTGSSSGSTGTGSTTTSTGTETTSTGSGSTGTGSTGSGSSGSGSTGSGSGSTGSTTTEAESTSNTSSGSSETFGLPFVKGMNANFLGEGANNVPEEVSEMRSVGASWTREDLAWSEVEPEKGVYDWTPFDHVVAEAKENGISVLPIVGYAPSWTSPTNATAFAEFVAAAVARYGPGTSANLQWWEVWNEPYFAYAWSEKTPEPEAYARDFLAAAEAAKSVAPSVKLLISADYQEAGDTGGTTKEEKTWVSDMFTAVPSLGKWISGVSVHPYGGDPSTPLKEKGGYLDTSGQWGFQRIDTVREKFLAQGVNVPFWITEEGWSTWENSEATVAKDYSDLITQIKLRPWVRALFPFGLREDDPHPTNNQPGFGLLKYGTREPKAAWADLKEGLKTLV